MDLKAKRHWRCTIKGSAEVFTYEGTIIEAWPRLTVWLKNNRNGDFTLQCSRKPINPESEAADFIPQILFPETPEPTSEDNWESYYTRLLAHFEGSDSMARFIANEHFDQPQLPWVGDDRVVRFIHMNASSRQYQRADPAEYATLDSYVSSTYPDLYASLTLRN